MQSDRSQIYSIQGLRGLAALTVVIAHSFEHGKLGGVPALFTGRFGVEVFFVISGFVITLASGKGWFDPRDFAIRRFMRVAPLYWLTTFLVGGLAIALPSIFKNTSFDLSYFISSILFIPDPIPGTDDWRPLFKLGWTLNYEVFFYTIVCAFFWCRTSLLRSICLISVMLVFVALSFGIEIRSGIASFYFNLNLMPFIAGVVICEAFRQHTKLMARMADYTLVIMVIAIASLYWALQFSHEEYRTFPGHIALTSAAVTVVLTALSIEHVFSRSASIWSWLGNISYSLYLLHMFVVGAGWAVLRRVVGRGQDSAITPFAIVAIVIVSLIAATISYRLFEKPLAKLARRLASKPAHDPLDPVVIPKAI